MCLLERLCLLLLFFLINVSSDIHWIFTLAILDLARIHEPDVVVIIADELSRHLQDLLFAHSLNVAAYLQALHVSVSLELACLEQFELVNDTEGLKIDLFPPIIIAAIIKRCLEFDSNGTRIGLFGGQYA